MSETQDVGSHLNISLSDLAQLKALTSQLRSNFTRLHEQWEDVKAEALARPALSNLIHPSEVLVSKQSLQKLSVECDQLKSVLPSLVSPRLMTAHSRLVKMDAELEKMCKEREALQTEVVHWKTQVETAVADAQREKREQLELRVDVQELTTQLSQQSEFCSSLGAACCTLLWRVSCSEDSIHSIVAGSKSSEFLELISTSVQSYLAAYKDDPWPQQGTDEAIFIVALCGTATNIAASAFGREHLASSAQGRQIIDTFVAFVGDAPLEKSANMKALMLMTLFNVSINQKGVKYLHAKQGLVPMLGWHIREECHEECQANTLRLLLSLVSDDAAGIRLMHELKENLSTALLQKLTTSPQSEVRDLALDLLMDMRRLENEQ